MIQFKKYGAIDIGSNAIRLLVANVIEIEGREPLFRKSSLVRVPIRLGGDVFKEKRISEENIVRMTETMEAFKLLMRSHKVVDYKACATSAMREAENGEDVVKQIFKKTGVKINIIDGNDEAAIIANTDLQSLISTDRSYLYVDVGGGSTEFTLYSNKEVVASWMQYSKDYHFKPVCNPTEQPEAFAEIELFRVSMGIPKNKTWIMTPGDTKEELLRIYPDVINFCAENGYNFTGREHILAFGAEREK